MRTAPTTGWRARALGWLDVAALALLAYVPFLLSSPGRISADSKQYLYLDPGDFLARAPLLWDAHTGAGGVSHQHLGYLFPMGPWFWAADLVGVPTWAAQRLWLGTLSVLAALGSPLAPPAPRCWDGWVLSPARSCTCSPRTSWRSRPGRRSCCCRGRACPGWSASPTAPFAEGAGETRPPSPWWCWRWGRATPAPSCWSASARLCGSSPASPAGRRPVGRSAWRGGWGCWVPQCRCGGWLASSSKVATGCRCSTSPSASRRWLPRPRRSTCSAGWATGSSTAADRLGSSIDQAPDYLHDRLTVVATFGLAAAGLAAAVLVRWRHRGRFAALVLVGTVVAVGAWPLEDPEPLRRGGGSTSPTPRPAWPCATRPAPSPLSCSGWPGCWARP